MLGDPKEISQLAWNSSFGGCASVVQKNSKAFLERGIERIYINKYKKNVVGSRRFRTKYLAEVENNLNKSSQQLVTIQLAQEHVCLVLE